MFSHCDTKENFYRSLMVDFIRKKCENKKFNNILGFVLINTKLNNNHDHNDGILTEQESLIIGNLELTIFSLCH